jgi:hypothetical protein
MSEYVLLPEARRRLWLGYSILLKLAEEFDEDTLEETELREINEAALVTEEEKLTRLDDGTSEARLERTNE